MRKIIPILMSLLIVPAVAGPTQWTYPAAPRGDVIDDYQGQKVRDPFRWMEATDSPETKAWIAAERALTASALAQMPERDAIRARLTALWNYPRFSLPVKRGGHYFFTKNDGLQNQPVLFVQETLAAPPRVLIDPNTLSADGTVALGGTSASRDGKWLGYALKAAGSDWEEFFVRDIATGKDTSDRVQWVKFSGMSWTKDSRGFFYGRYPEVAKVDKLFGKLLNGKIYYHRLGAPQAEDVLVYEMPEHPDWMVGADVTDDGRYLLLSIRQPGRTQNALYYKDLLDPAHPQLGGPVVKLLDQFDANYSVVGNRASTLFVQTNLSAPRGKVIAIDLNDPSPKAWKTLVAETEDNLDSVDFIGGRFVIGTMHDVKSRLAVFAADGRPLGEIALPGIGSLAGVSGRDDESEFFYSYSSFLSPPTTFRHDLATGKGAIFQESKVAFDPSPYETEQVWVTSKDGTKVPMFVTHRKGLVLDGKAPTWLYGYGGFNITMHPTFSIPTLVWLELGGVYAVANLRGGGEYGDAWHLAGTKERKQNVFDDYIAAADWLVARKFTSHEKLVIQGRSNGGLLVGAVLNQRPDLAAVAFPQVGVMDMLRYHKFTVGTAWAGDYGTSDTPEGFAYLRAYSPLHTIKSEARYPAVFITTGDHDDRVFPAHSFKYAATLQAAMADSKNPALIRIESNAGHGGSSGTTPVSKTIEEWSDMFAFATHTLGMPVK
ncbi:MAG: prolyl endopeptidase [Verrucomicrobia bacterium]|nr:prolyl endopeptidase [Verrucomicrobiota bacterium]